VGVTIEQGQQKGGFRQIVQHGPGSIYEGDGGPRPFGQDATAKAIPRLNQNFFRVRFDRLTPSEKNFLRATAHLGPGPQRTGDIAEALGVKISSLGPVRAKLIKKGMIYSPAHGDMAFTVPLFDEFMVRAIPEFNP